jgi:predicted nucleic-acid-binding Zn-ribbon protein
VNEQFLARFVRDSACSVCGNTSWSLANEGKPISLLSFAAAENPRVDVIAVCCNACGYMRFHATEIVRQAADGPS